jgi:hypothetical protein
MARRSSLVFAIALLGLATGVLASCHAPSITGPEPSAPPLPQLPGLDRPVAFDTDVKPVFESRCVVCHGCYDAPCQLLLSSFDGATRGASKESVYDTTRLTAMAPTRLGIDAHTTAEWRGKGFFAVLDGADERTPAAGSASRARSLRASGFPTPCRSASTARSPAPTPASSTPTPRSIPRAACPTARPRWGPTTCGSSRRG